MELVQIMFITNLILLFEEKMPGTRFELGSSAQLAGVLPLAPQVSSSLLHLPQVRIYNGDIFPNDKQ